MPETVRYYPALTKVNMLKFKQALAKASFAEFLKADLSKYKHKNGKKKLARETVKSKDHLPDPHEQLEIK